MAVAESIKEAENALKKEAKPHLVGLKVGLEIHQQLSGLKLFCNCKAEIIERQADFAFSRQLRAIAGETGTIDRAAASEQAKSKSYTYNCFNESTCLVELDEEPPHPINQEAIITGIMVAKAFGSTILPHMQVMRKTVVDGSAVSAFQRTGLFGFGGFVPELSSQVRIQTLCIEEDAAKIISRGANEDVYNISRLGIPLLEIATEPDITTPEKAQEVAAQIGMVLRSTKRVKRGLGTIRQDVNVSIPGGTRVEIKGCQDLRLIPAIIEHEAKRQQTLLSLKEKLNSVSSSIKRELATLSSTDCINVTDAFKTSTASFIKQSIAKGDYAMLLQVPHFAGIFGQELCPNYRVGSELADLARSRGFGGLINSDEDFAKYGIKNADFKTEYAKSTAGFIVLIGDEKRIESAIDDLIIPRIMFMLDGVPAEVRKANPDATTSFQRPMSGASRMYPETDIRVVEINESGISAPRLLSEQIQDIIKRYNISEDQAKQIVREGLPFEEWLLNYKDIDPTFLATSMLTFGKEIQSRYKKEIDHIALLEPLLATLHEKKISKSAVFEILVDIAEGKTALEKIDYSRYAGIADAELMNIVKEEMQKNPNLAVNGIMGNVMLRVRGKADGKKVMELINQLKK